MPYKLINGERVFVELPQNEKVFNQTSKLVFDKVKAASEARGRIQRQTLSGAAVSGAKKPTLAKAIAMLDPAIDAHWTKTGLPDLNTLSELTGKKLKRADVVKIAAGFERKDAEFAAQASKQ